MPLIKNYSQLATSPKRKIVLDLMEAGLDSIRPEKIVTPELINSLGATEYSQVFLIGIGKGSGQVAKILERNIVFTDGYVIDNVVTTFDRLKFTLGTHPLPSQQNLDFTKTVLENISNLTPNDLVLVAICGGGSAMFEYPKSISLTKLNLVSEQLLTSRATIQEINSIRKHLSVVKGGKLAQHLYPAKVISLIFSDVPGNDLSTIASGPTVINQSTIDDALQIIKKYDLDLGETDLAQTPVDRIFFDAVTNKLVLSNLTALKAMKDRAESLGCVAKIYSDKFQGDAKTAGAELLMAAESGEITLVGGETTLKVSGTGHGGRNQTLVLGALKHLAGDQVIASFDSDGIDNYVFAGAIGDRTTLEKGLDPDSFLAQDNSYEFFRQVGDGIETGKLESNVSDLMIISKI